MPARVLLAVLLSGAALLGGCGTSDDRAQVRGVIDRFYDAIREDDPQTACAQLSTATREQLESQTGQSCDGVITRLGYEGGAIVDAHVYITNADVELRDGERAFLARERDGWKLTAIACTPQEGLPRDRPFDCEVEA